MSVITRIGTAKAGMRWPTHEEHAMAKKFDPAPPDKHADKTAGKESRGKQARDALERGLKESFPASDPPSNTQPGKTSKDTA
jgi:hypothetical protein